MKTKLSLLALSISLISSYGYALESLSDESMGEVTAQDGINMHAVASNIAMTRLFWQDDAKELQFRGVNIQNLDALIAMDFGADSDLLGATPAIAINVTVKPLVLKVASIGLCAANTTCATNFGEFALETTTDSTFSYFNTNGFYDGSTSNGRFRFNVSNANAYYAQTFDVDGAGPTAPVRNLAIFKNLTLNGSVNGKFSIDTAEGLRTQGTLSFNKVGNVNGFQFDLAHASSSATSGSSNPALATAGTFSTTNAKTILRFGMSGNILNYDAKMRADNTLSPGAGGLGLQGIKLSYSGVLDKNTFQMEVGHPSAYSVIFKNWVDLANGAAVVPSSPDFTLGDIYLDLIPAGSLLPNFTTGYGAGFGVVGGGSSTDAVGVAVRGLNFQAFPKVLAFQNNSTFVQTSQNWSLITALYNLDANLLMFPDGHPNPLVTTKRGIGFDLKMAATGRDGTGKEGTHILVADPTAGTYMGLRNLNAQVGLTQGQFFLADLATDGVDGIKFTSKNMSLDLSGEFAVGRLPNGGSVTTILNTDEMYGLRLRLAGEIALALSPPPTGSGYLGLSGQLVLVDPNPTFHNTLANSVLPDPAGVVNSMTIVEPTDGTQLQLSDISGTINMNPEHIKQGQYPDRPAIVGHSTADFTDASRIEVGNNTVSFAAALEFGPGLGAANVVRIGDVNMAIDNDNNVLTPIPAGNTYRLGEIVIPGGRLYTQIDVKPQ